MFDYWDAFMIATQVCQVPDTIWSPSFLQASSEFVRGYIPSSAWLAWISLANSENFEHGVCILHNLGNVGV